MVATSPAQFAAAADADHPLPAVELEPQPLVRAESSVVATGLLIVGEPHGVRETPSQIYPSLRRSSWWFLLSRIDFTRPKRCPRQRTERREDRHSNFYEISDTSSSLGPALRA